MPFSAFATGSVTLTWIACTNPCVAGYNVYYGGASGAYTNVNYAGNTTNVTISGLTQGTTYYFAATSLTASGMESPFSSEVSYFIPLNAPATNQPPTLNAITNLSINENAGLQTVSLSGITTGDTNGNQTLTVTAVSSNTGLIPNPTVNYTNPSTTGSLTFTPVTNNYGVANITVTVNDNSGASNNLVTQTFTVIVNATNTGPTLNPINNTVVNVGAGKQIVTLTGIGSGTTNQNQPLRITTTCSDSRVVSRPAIRYVSPATTGTLTFWPGSVPGTATVCVTVNNGQKSNNTITRSFTVTVVPRGASTTITTSTGSSGTTNSSSFAASLSPASRVNGQFALTVAGAAGHQYVVEASTDLVNWVPVGTNTAPFTLVDPDANKFDHRFYRSVFIH